MFGKDVLSYQADQRAHGWRRHAGEEVAGKVVAVVGAGRIGREAARLLRALDAHVIGVVRTIADRTPADVHADEIAAIGDLDAILPRLDAVVLATPAYARDLRPPRRPPHRAPAASGRSS